MVKYDRLMTTEEIVTEAKQLGSQIQDITAIPGDSLMLTLLLTCGVVHGNVLVLKTMGTDTDTIEILQDLLRILRAINKDLAHDKASITFNPEDN